MFHVRHENTCLDYLHVLTRKMLSMEEEHTKAADKEKYLAKKAKKMGAINLSAQLDPKSPDFYYRFAGALAAVFAVDPLIVAQLYNYGYLSMPYIPEDWPMPNYAQVLTFRRKGRDPIEELLSFLVSHADPLWHESYQHSAFDKERLRSTISSIALIYSTAVIYVRWVSDRLWRDPFYLETQYGHYVKLLQTRIDAFKKGEAYVFDHMDECFNRPVFTR